MRALVTGVTGTVGSVVARRLAAEGLRVRGLVRQPGVELPPSVEAVTGDLADAGALRRAAEGAELIVHCAAALNDDPGECRRVNVEGTRSVVEAGLAAGSRRLVHLSTVSVYDYRARTSFDEDSPLWTGAPDDYGRSKAEAERIVLTAQAPGLERVILRPVVVLAMHPRSYWGPLALERARVSDAPIVPFRFVPYVHVENLAGAVSLAARARGAAGRAYNVIDGHGPAEEYLEAVGRALGRPAAELPPAAPDIRYAGERIRAELGYAPEDRWSAFLTALSSAGPRRAVDRP